MKEKQLEMWHHLNDKSFKKRFVHGGEQAKGKRKEFRPLSTKDPIHLVLRSSKAKGTLSFRNKAHRTLVHQIIKKQAKRFYVQLKNYQNVGNHLHLEVKISGRHEFQ